MDRPRRHAFTLIELLVVIAVIAVLIGIILPSLRGARESARATQCLAKLREIGLASTFYARDQDDFVPREGARPLSPNDPNTNPAWACCFRPYLDQNSVTGLDVGDQFAGATYYRCPTRPPSKHNIHYVANAVPFLGRDRVDPRTTADALWRRPPTRLSSIHRTSEVIYIAEFADDAAGVSAANIYRPGEDDFSIAQWYDVWTAGQVNGPAGETRVSHRRHGRGSNAVFFDGHAATVPEARSTLLDAWNDGIYQTIRPGR